MIKGVLANLQEESEISLRPFSKKGHIFCREMWDVGFETSILDGRNNFQYFPAHYYTSSQASKLNIMVRFEVYEMSPLL